jgi:hypothetical protein
MEITTISYKQSIKLAGPGPYESRDYEFGAFADLQDGEDPAQATAKLAAFVKGVMSEQIKPFTNWRLELRRAKLQEIAEALPKELRHLIDPEMLVKEGAA